MNKQTEALKMAIEALDDLELCDYATAQKAIQACKEALEQEEALNEMVRLGQEMGAYKENNHG